MGGACACRHACARCKPRVSWSGMPPCTAVLASALSHGCESIQTGQTRPLLACSSWRQVRSVWLVAAIAALYLGHNGGKFDQRKHARRRSGSH